VKFDESELDDAVLQALPADLFKARVNLLCLQARVGAWSPADVAFHLRMVDPYQVEALLWLMRDYGLIEESEGRYTVAGRARRKTSAERMRRLRARHAARHSDVTGDTVEPYSLATEFREAPPPEPEPEPVDADTEHLQALRSHASVTAIRIASLCFATPQEWPIGWIGAESTVFRWMRDRDWQPPIMLAACKAAMEAKEDGAPESIVYFEEFIAKAHAPAAPAQPEEKVA
jgi:hypothetical protein